MLSERLVCDNVHANFVLLRELVKLLGYLSVDAEDTGPESPQFCTRDNPPGKIDTGIVTTLLVTWDSLNPQIKSCAQITNGLNRKMSGRTRHVRLFRL